MNRIACSSFFAAGILLSSVPMAHARLAGNTLAPDKLAANAPAANRLAASSLAVEQLGPNEYVVNPEAAAALLTTESGREVLSFILSCALPENITVSATAPDGAVYQFLGDIGLASEWLEHPLREAGRGWVSACLFARVNDHGVPQAFSMRGQNKALATTPEELATFTLEEGAFFGDYFAASGASPIACRGQDQASGEFGGLVSRDCAEPDPADATRTLCGFRYAGDCGDFAPDPACKHFAPHDYYRKCQDPAIGAKSIGEVITVFVLP